MAGAAALVRDWHQARPRAPPPSPALTKALLVNTATDLGGGDNGKGSTIAAGPNHDQGWGRVNLGDVFDATTRDLRDQADDVLTASGRPARPELRRGRPGAAGEGHARVDRRARAPSPANPVVNDLDLVVDAGGRTYKGNVFDGGVSRTGGSADPRNNVESVYLPAGTAGASPSRSRATGIAGDGVPGNGDTTDQDFALVVSNADRRPRRCSRTTPRRSTRRRRRRRRRRARARRDLRARRAARNAGDAGATGVRARCSAAAGLTRHAGQLGLPDHRARRGLAAERHRLRRRARERRACGADVAATLRSPPAGGTQTVPLTLPTGAPGPPCTPLDGRARSRSPTTTPAGVSLLGVRAGARADQGPRRAHRRHRPPAGSATCDRPHRPRRDDRAPGRPPRRPEQRRRQLRGTVFDDEAAADIVAGHGALHRQLPAAERPALALRRQAASRAPGRCACATSSRATPGRWAAGACRPGRRSATSTRRRPTPRSRGGAGEPDQLDLGAVRLRLQRRRRATSSAGSTEPPTSLPRQRDVRRPGARARTR